MTMFLNAGRDDLPELSSLGSVLPALITLAANSHGGPPRERIDRFRLDSNARSFDRFLQRPELAPARGRIDRMIRQDAAYRADAPAGGIQGGLFLARQLEQVATRVLRQPLPPLSALEIFPVAAEVSPGATHYTVRRLYTRGSASVYNGGQRNMPTSGLAQREEQVPIRHLVAGAKWSIFDQQSADFGNFAMVEELLRASRRAILELHNSLVWNGSAASGINGILNYPWLDRKLVATAFSASATVTTMIDEIMALISYPALNSSMTFQPTHVAMSHKLYDFLSRTLVNTANGSNATILEIIAKNNSARIPLANFIPVWELADAGPGSTQGVFVYRKDEDAIRLVVSQSMTTLPLQEISFDMTQFLYQSIGGVLMADVGNNLLAWVDLDA